MNGYSARQLPDGQIIVICPDGLTWEVPPGHQPTLESAQAYALLLNEWIDSKPDPARVSPFFKPTIPIEGPGGDALLRSIDKIFAAEERLDQVIHAARGHTNHPQEVQNGTQ